MLFLSNRVRARGFVCPLFLCLSLCLCITTHLVMGVSRKALRRRLSANVGFLSWFEVPTSLFMPLSHEATGKMVTCGPES